ncbi:MAG TPA: DMT family transporter [Clostridia bacterium]|nr:DMT family transporter [Clostridia bacterium]
MKGLWRVKSQKRLVLISEAALLLAGVIWGSGFVVMKNSLEALSINWLICLRFVLAALVTSAFVFKKLLKGGKALLKAGAVCGGLMYLAFVAQTEGLSRTTAGNNAFLTAAYVVLVPFFQWAQTKNRPSPNAVLAGFLCLFGVGILALKGDFSINVGDALTLLCGALYAMHLLAISGYIKKGVDMLSLTAMQFIFTALFAFLAAFVFEAAPPLIAIFNPKTLFPLFYLGLICTLLALLLQNIGLKHAPPDHASLLMSTEAPFGFIFGMIFLNEPFSLRFLFGAAFIAASIVISAKAGEKQLEESAAVEPEEAL